MSKISHAVCPAEAGARKQVRMSVKPIAGLLALALLMACSPARAADPADEYLQIRALIQRADELNTTSTAAQAKAKYQQAQAALASFQRIYPGWNAKLVAYRLSDVAQKVAALSEKPAAPAGAGTATSAAAAPASAEAAESGSSVQVKLLEAGAEPRKVLRLNPKPGDKQRVSLTVKVGTETSGGGGPSQAMKLPAMTMAMDVTVKEVSNSGDITYEVVLGETGVADDPDVIPQVAEAMKAALGGVKGMSATGRMSSRGFSKGTEFKAMPSGDAQTRQMMEQMKDSLSQVSSPLPEEAVGPGAKWEVKMPIKSQGMRIEQTTVCELVSIEGEKLTTKVALTQRAANQKVQNPAMPGLKVDVTKMVSKGSGEFTRELGKPMPTTGTSKMQSETSMTMDMGGQKQAMTMKMDLSLRLEAK